MTAEVTGEALLRQFRKAKAEMASLPEWRREAIRAMVRSAGARPENADSAEDCRPRYQ